MVAARCLIRFWFAFERSVGRRDYVACGLSLAALKYCGDVLIVWLATRQFWTPLDYVNPLQAERADRVAHAPPLVLPLLAVWALPSMWAGMSMSERRSLDAGRSAWLALLFFIPYVRYAFMLFMSTLPTDLSTRPSGELPLSYERKLPGALLAAGAFISRIHERVLKHIKAVTERGVTATIPA